MRAPEQNFANALDEFRHRYPEYDCQFLARARQCTSVPRARTANDYVELAGSLYVAWTVGRQWPRRPEVTQQFQQEMIRSRDAIRPLLKENWLYPSVRRYLEQREQVFAAGANYSGEIFLFEGIEGRGLPKRRDHLTFADLGRERRGAGMMLFVREVSAAMRAIFGKPHDKTVGELAGLAFETKAALSLKTVRTMCRETTLTRPK
jgi:hypothetical protein